jgi:phosphoribosylformylglycinamidine (FGAM) synthase-like amidotransferase family enzyme
MIHIAVIQTSHSHLKQEIILALERADMKAHVILWNAPEEKLEAFDGFVITDFSDAVAARSSFMQELKKQSKLGKPVLGIGDGAPVLVEAGLVPGLERDQVGITLQQNKKAEAYIRLSKGYQWNVFTRRTAPNAILRIFPAQTVKECFEISSVLLAEMERNGLIVFQYCDENGTIANHSIQNIAAVSNKSGNVMAVLPHLECAPDADSIFKSMRDYIEKGCKALPAVLNYQPRSWT